MGAPGELIDDSFELNAHIRSILGFLSDDSIWGILAGSLR